MPTALQGSTSSQKILDNEVGPLGLEERGRDPGCIEHEKEIKTPGTGGAPVPKGLTPSSGPLLVLRAHGAHTLISKR